MVDYGCWGGYLFAGVAAWFVFHPVGSRRVFFLCYSDFLVFGGWAVFLAGLVSVGLV